MTAIAVDPRAVRRLLIVRPRYLGDLCLTLPVLDAARERCPGARIAYVAEAGPAELLAGDPRVDEPIVVRRAPGLRGTAALVARLRRFAPDVAIDLFCNPRTAVWCALSGARVRVGYPNKGWRSQLYTHLARPRTLSATGFHLASLEALGWEAPGGPWSGPSPARGPVPRPRLHLPPDARAEAESGLAGLDVPAGATLVGFHPGARWPTRRWAPERFVELARRLLESRRDAVAIVTGGPDERERVDAVAGPLGGRARAVVGWPIRRFVALQSLCAAFVCGDTGPLHTAVAAGTPTLGLLSRNRPAMFFPYDPADGHRAFYARAECSPCHRDTCADLRCLERLTAAGAWTLLEGMLEHAERPGTTGRGPGADAGRLTT
jgi:ADP-heptose:LPS heptosyltransferase